MLVAQIIEAGYPLLSVTDKVSFALQLMEDYDIQHLPVTAQDKFVGIVSKDDLMDVDDHLTLGTLQDQFIVAAVLPEEHFTTALKIARRFDVSVVPSVNKEGEVTGLITQKILIRTLANYFNVEEPGGIIVLEIDRRNFSFGELSRLIETNNDIITQMNTCTESDTGLLIVTIKINKVTISDVIATLQRYEYIIRYYFGEEDYENELRSNYDLLMTYLNI